MVQAYGRLFGTRKPVFDGRNNILRTNSATYQVTKIKKFEKNYN
jgi:hypothetical protein